jgi:cell division protein FtsB
MVTRGRNSVDIIKRAFWPAVALLIIANFLGYAIVGANGILSWGDYRRQKETKLVELAALSQEQVKLAHRVQLLDPRSADPDYSDETVRRQLGLVAPDEVIVQLPN